MQLLHTKHYRAAARELEIAIGKESIAERIELKKYMALSLSLAGTSLTLETQIYALAGFYLLVTCDKEWNYQNDSKTLEELLQTSSCEHFAENDQDESTLSKAVKTYRQDSRTLQQFRNALLSVLRFTILEKYLNSDRRETGADPQPIRVPSHAGIGISYLIGDILLEYTFYGKSQSNKEKFEIRKLIDKIMKDALEHYSNREYSDFLYSLTAFYAKPKLLVGIKQVKQDGNNYRISLDIRPRVIVNELLSYNFSPEGIANFLVLLGEVLLSRPKLEPRNKLSADICFTLPTYFDFTHSAIIVFEEVVKNIQLAERANYVGSKVKPEISAVKAKRLEHLDRTLLNNAYIMSNDYIVEKSMISSITRLEEVKIIAKVDCAIAQLILGGSENLQQSTNIMKSVKEDLIKNPAEEKMSDLTDIRLQALTDILATFRYRDDRNEVARINPKFPQLPNDVHLKAIDKVLINDNKVSHCEPVVLFDNDEVDEFALLDEVLDQFLKLDKNKFVRNVRNNYYNNVEPVTSWINEIIKKENLSTIKGWKTSFLERKHSLTFQYLSFLSVMYNLIFMPGVVKSHPNHDRIFATTKEVIDFSKGSAKITVFVLTEGRSDLANARPIKGIFIACAVGLSYIYNQLDSASDQKIKIDLINQIAL